jgi:hypothetical protein
MVRRARRAREASLERDDEVKIKAAQQAVQAAMHRGRRLY